MEKSKKNEVKPTEQPQAPKPLNDDQLGTVIGGAHDLYTQVGKLPAGITQFVE